jgi:hypothetical protein
MRRGPNTRILDSLPINHQAAAAIGPSTKAAQGSKVVRRPDLGPPIPPPPQ